MRRLTMLFIVLTVLLASACGVRSQDAPAVLSEARLPNDEPPTSTPAEGLSGQPVVLFLVRDDHLAPTPRTLKTPDVRTRLEALLAGPTDDDLSAGFRSAIPARSRLGDARLDGTILHFGLPHALSTIGGQEQILALGQIVFTATEEPAIAGVVFERAGEELEVPTGDGTVSAGPVRREDYAALFVNRDRPAP